MDKLLISVICYDNSEEVVAFAKGLRKQSALSELLLLVTCNKCADVEDLKQQLEETKINFELFNPEQNLGYLNGCLYPFTQKKYEYKWCLICNTDIEFGTDEFFETFRNKQIAEDVWCVAPNVVQEDKSRRMIQKNPFFGQRPAKYRVRVWKLFYGTYCTFLTYIFLANVKRKFIRQTISMTDGKIYAAHGCCFWLKKVCVDKLLLEDNKIFMYGEELYIAGMVEEVGKIMYYFKDLHVEHFSSQVTGFIGSKRKHKWFRDAINYIYERFYLNK